MTSRRLPIVCLYNRVMPLQLSMDELLKYTAEERDRWRRWLSANPAGIDAAVQPGGRFPTVGRLIDHPWLHAVANGYFGAPATILDVRLWWSFASASDVRDACVRWHNGHETSAEWSGTFSRYSADLGPGIEVSDITAMCTLRCAWEELFLLSRYETGRITAARLCRIAQGRRRHRSHFQEDSATSETTASVVSRSEAMEAAF